MGSVNKVILVGNLGADPELKYTPSNRPVCNLSIATNEVFKDKGGQRQERTEWHRVTVWGEQAENCSKYLAKGRMVYIEGRLQTRSWDDKTDGKKRYSTEIVADRVTFLGGGAEGGAAGGARKGGRSWGDEGGAQASGGGGAAEPEGHGPPPPSDDDIPF
jgi:single-strand DNA-binding protein